MFFLSSYDHFQRKLIIIAKSQGFFPWLFSLSWEQRKLSDLAEKTYGGGTPATSNEAFWNGSIPWIQSSDIADGKLFGVVPRKYITNEALNKSATQLVPANSLAIITRVGVGKLAFMPFSYTTSQDFLSLSKLNTEPFFTVYACYKKLQSELNAVQGTSIKGITKDELLAKAIMVPKYREQEQIGCFFRSLDNLITLHQHEPLFLVMLFSGGSCVFKSAWEQRKVSDMFKVTRGYVLAATLTADSQSETMPFPVYSSQTKDNGLMGFYKDYLYEDAITWTTDGANAGTVNYRAGKFYCTNVCGVLLSDKIAANQMVAEALNNVAKGYVSYVGNPKLMNNVMADIEIMIPPKQEEREQISKFFEYLDDLITLHQRKGNQREKKSLDFAWEQRKLGEVGKARSGIGFPDAEQGGVEGIPFFKVSDMNTAGNENEMTTANNYVTEAQIVSHRWHPITELPALFFAKVGAAVMLNRKRLCRFPFLLDNNTMAYSLNEDCWDADFAKALFETVDLTTLIQVGALPSYNAGDVENMEIYLPAHSEQQKIGALFKHLDDLITLHQREHKSNFRRKTNVKQSTRDRPFLLLLCSVDKGLQRGSGP